LNAEDAGRLAAAFPPALGSDVRAAVARMPVARIPPTDFPIGFTNAGRTVPVSVGGEKLVIPYRIYNPEPPGTRPSRFVPRRFRRHLSAASISDLTSSQQGILACLYTRHHDGFVRQRWLKPVLSLEDDWAVPFIVALAGEYVLDIILDIRRAVAAAVHPGSPQRQRYGRFIAENRRFFDLVRDRATSYWNCYHRTAFARADYPAFSLLTALADSAGEG
jgi:hypothetical protein